MVKKKEAKPPNRVGFQINLSIEEKELIKSAAEREGLAIAAYIRSKALAAATIPLPAVETA